MVGLIWFVQIVHYPLMQCVGQAQFVNYEQQHARFTTWVVGPSMLVEMMTLACLLYAERTVIPRSWLWVSASLLAVIWLSTQFIQVPCHTSLSHAWDADIHRRLVQSNWIRTIAWSLRGLILLACVAQPGRIAD